MTQNLKRRPPVSLSDWAKQVEDDPSISSEFKNSIDGRLKVSSTAFNSGSVVTPTEYLHLNILWHKYVRIESLDHLMKDDPEISYAGYISPDNIRKAHSMFESKRHFWQAYLTELKERAEDLEDASAATRTTRPPESHRTKMRHKFLRPSLDHGNPFWSPLFWQLQMLAFVTPDESATATEIERASMITETGPGSSVVSVFNQPVSPNPPRLPGRSVQHDEGPGNESTPPTKSFPSANWGESGEPVAGKFMVRRTLNLLLLAFVSAFQGEFSSLCWLPAPISFNLAETSTITEVNETGKVQEVRTTKELMTVLVDGFLSQEVRPDGRDLGTDALAIMSVNPFPGTTFLAATRRHEGAGMACWISEAGDSMTGDSMTGLLQPSASGEKRRLMVTQHRHEVFIIVAEYGVGYEEHIRPTISIAKDSIPDPDPDVEEPSASRSPTVAPQDDPGVDAHAGPRRRSAELLAGSPSYIKLVEKMSIEVEGVTSPESRGAQPTQPPTGTSEWAGEERKWVPDAADFLIMHEFGPFLIQDASHMELFSKCLIAFMLQLRGPQGFVPEPTSRESSASLP